MESILLSTRVQKIDNRQSEYDSQEKATKRAEEANAFPPFLLMCIFTGRSFVPALLRGREFRQSASRFRQLLAIVRWPLLHFLLPQ